MSQHIPKVTAKPVVTLPGIPDFMTVREAARALGISRTSVYRYISRGKLRAVRVGGVIMLPEDAVYAHQRVLARRRGLSWLSLRGGSGEAQRFA